MVDGTLVSCCCWFFSSGSDREHDGVTTVVELMGEGVMQEMDTSWNHTHLYALSLNHCCYLCHSCSCLLGGMSRCWMVHCTTQLELRGVQTLASAHALCLPHTCVQVFQVHSGDSEDFQRWWKHFGSLEVIWNWSIVQRERSVDVK